MTKPKYNVGDDILIYEPLDDGFISKKVEAVCKDSSGNIYYITDPIDLCLLGVKEDELKCIPEYQLAMNKIKRDSKKLKNELKKYPIIKIEETVA